MTPIFRAIIVPLHVASYSGRLLDIISLF